MRVIHLYDGHEKIFQGQGSVPNVVWNIAHQTASSGHDVTVIERKWNGLESRDEHKGVKFRRLDLSTGSSKPWDEVPYEQTSSLLGVIKLVFDRINFALTALQKLRHMDYDVIHVHLPFSASVIASVSPGIRKKMIYTAHLGELRLNALTGTEDGNGEDELNTPAIISAFSPDIYLIKRCLATTILNPGIKTALESSGISSSKLHVVPNGVNVERFANVKHCRVMETARKYAVIDKKTILFVGSIMPRKGVKNLIKSVSKLINEFNTDDVKLLVAGEDELDGEYTKEVHSLATEEGIEDHVQFLGYVSEEELPYLYNLADVFTMPSLEEGFGMTITEAMAAGTPVVASNVGGIPQQIADGKQGFLLSPGSVDEFTNKIDVLLSDDSLRLEMAENARAKANQYSWERVNNSYLKLYNELL